MKLLLSLTLICAMASAKPMDENEKPEKSTTLHKTKNETVLNNNHRKQRDDQPSETEKNDSKTYLNPADDKSR